MNTVSKPWLATSLLIAGFSATASLLGIGYVATYSRETADWAIQAIGQDIGNLLAVLVLVGSVYALPKKSPAAFVIWVGALLYFIYAYIVYAFFVHFNYLFLLYVAVLGLSVYTLIGGLCEQSAARLAKSLPQSGTTAASVLLIGIGALFGLLWLAEIVPSLMLARSPASAVSAGLWVNPIHVIDLSLVLPGMITTGILLRKGHPVGRIFAAPWLTFSILMGSSIIATLILESRRGTVTLVPMVMMSAIVLGSLFVLFRNLRTI